MEGRWHLNQRSKRDLKREKKGKDQYVSGLYLNLLLAIPWLASYLVYDNMQGTGDEENA